MKDDLECFAIYWAIAYSICIPPPGCEDVPFLLTPETPEDSIKLHLPLKTSIKTLIIPLKHGSTPEKYGSATEEFHEN